MSEIKVNKISPRTACGTTTLGDSGDSFTIPAGVTITNNGTQTGFGRTGTVDWQTTIQTSTPFTAVSGKGYFINTTSGAITMNLPSSPSVGDIVAIKDYAGTFADNNLTIGRGGSNMNGTASDNVRNTANESLTMVYADATKGWLAVEEGTGFIGEDFVSASGGTETTSGNYKIHSFTGPGTFTVCSISSITNNNIVSYVVVAGGGGGGGQNYQAGGGGAGGFREYKGPADCYTASPLNGNPGGTAITVSATAYPITVGAGGTRGTSSCRGNYGNDSVFSTVTSTKGGGGGNRSPVPQSSGNPGGSGGGAGRANDSSTVSGGTGNNPPVSPSQGNNGGGSPGPMDTGPNNYQAGAGGGATAVGESAPQPPGFSNGGAGATTSITGSPVAYAGGGGSGGAPAPVGNPQGVGGTGGGGNGAVCAVSPTTFANGGTNTGGGGGGGSNTPINNAGDGGSGIVIIRYKYQ